MAVLDSGTPIGRFRVVSLLGAGGMGEVYLARDESLDRSVALKILPPALVRNDERVRRFVQEAKSASSLNHPHIVTIYEIGQADVPSTGSGQALSAGSGPTESVHYIAMEFVQGHTLRDLIHADRTDLRTLVRYLAQAADGLAKAHAAGLVHRDLKPDNIMVTADGFAKVVDFGLAKLVEQTPADGAAATALGSPTGAGTILGTVGYMSPEQVQGKAVDHRSDIFSFGCVLYEAATRRRPFQADSDSETLAGILRDAPAPVEEANPTVPGELRRLIRRCLAKSADRRLQSMKDLALELADIEETWDTLSTSSAPSSGATSATAMGLPASRRGSTRVRIALGAGAVTLAAALVWTAWWLGAGRGAAPLAPGLEIALLARIQDMTGAILSQDERLLVYTARRDGRTSLIVRQLATGEEIIVVSDRERLDLLAVAPDSSYAYFQAPADDGSGVMLHRVSTVGGAPRPVMKNVRQLSLSPDSKRFAAAVQLRQETAGWRYSLVIANADGTEPRTLADQVSEWMWAPAWSPDAKHIVVSVMQQDRVSWLMAYGVDDGTARRVGRDEWWVQGLAWLPDGRGLVATGGPIERERVERDPAATATSQVWHISWPDGAPRRLTNDTNNYGSGLGVSADGRTVTTSLVRSEWSVWRAPTERPDALARIPRIEGYFQLRGWAGLVDPLPDGRVLALHLPDGGIWTTTIDGASRQRLTPERLVPLGDVVVAARADVVVFRASNAGDPRPDPRLFRMDTNGRDLTELPGDEWRRDLYLVALSPDGGTLYYSTRDADGLWRRPLAGGPEESLGEVWVRFSPDGTRYLHIARSLPGESPPQYEIRSSAGDRLLQTLTIDPAFNVGGWMPSGDALLASRDIDGARNLWRLPLDGRAPMQLTHYGPGYASRIQFSADGRWLLVSRSERLPGEVVQIRKFR